MTSGPVDPRGPLGDEDLLRRLQGGDESALEALVERHRGLLLDRIRARLSPAVLRKVSVADAIQEVRWIVVRRCHDFEDRGPGSVRAWMARIAELRASELARHYGGREKRSVRREVSHGQRDGTGEFRGAQATPSEAAIATEEGARVRRAMTTLSEDHQQVLRLAQQEGLTLREVADRMGRTREAVKKLYARALANLAKAFDDDRGSRS